MENYEKGSTIEVEEELPFSSYNNVVQMKVTAGSKVRNIIGYALKKLKEPDVKYLSWNGAGHAVTKTVTCAEITKKKIKGLHQITKIRFRRLEEYWEPKIEGLERLKVNRDIPAISILLSKDPLDPSEPGFQCRGSLDALWSDSTQKKRSQRRAKSGVGTQGGKDSSRKKKQKREVQGNESSQHLTKMDT